MDIDSIKEAAIKEFLSGQAVNNAEVFADQVTRKIIDITAFMLCEYQKQQNSQQVSE